MNTVKTSLLATGTLVAFSLLSAHVAWAGSYSTIEEIPIRGGELRLTSEGMELTVQGKRIMAHAFPLQHTDVDIQIDGVMAEVTVTQTFQNPFDDAVEAVYLFPLGDEAGVHAYEIIIGERTIRGEIKTRRDARDTYERAKSEGRTAGLLEQHKPNIFQQSIANIPPGEEVKVRFKYVELLDYSDREYEFVFPMVVGPRFLPGETTEKRPVGSHAHGNGKTSPVSIPYLADATRSGHDISLEIRLDPGTPAINVTSPSHRISAPERGNSATELTMSLDPSDRIPNKDFILRFSAAGASTTIGILTHREKGSDGFFTLIVQPKADYQTGDITSREVVVLIDVSGSMSGPPIQQAQAITLGLIDTLQDGDTFNIVSFASGVGTFRPRPVAATQSHKQAGVDWVMSLHAGGGTQMLSGIARSLKRPPGSDMIRMVYIVTDGYIGNDGEILASVQKKGGHNRIFPVGVGSAPNRYLIDRLADVGRGFPSYIGPHDPADTVVETLISHTAFPYLTDIEIDWGGLRVSDLTPEVIPDVYAGQPIAISGRYSGSGTREIRVNARIAGREVTTPIAVDFPRQEQRKGVAYLWARRRIKELASRDFNKNGKEIEEGITELGLAFHLVTDYTSFVAVAEQRIVDSGGNVRTIVQPVPVPDGVSHQGVFGPVQHQPTVAARTPQKRRSWSPSFGGGGGGAIDPLTIGTFFLLIPAARALRRRRRRKEDDDRHERTDEDRAA